MGVSGNAVPAVTLSEAQAFVRIETGEEEALLAGLIRTASNLCEAFVGQVVLARNFTADMAASGRWQRIGVGPVQAISGVEAVALDGTAEALLSDSYAIDIDARGDGWVRLYLPGELKRIRVSGTAGMASDRNAVPEAIRQGVLRLVAHLFSARDAEGGEPPAAVTALWRPYRRMRMA